MEILGHTVSGKIIVVVSQEEWDSLQSGVKPLDNNELDEKEKRQREFLKTPVGQVLAGLRGHSAKTQVKYLYIHGKIDGTIGNLLQWLDGGYLRSVSDKSIRLLIEALQEAQANNARPSHP